MRDQLEAVMAEAARIERLPMLSQAQAVRGLVRMLLALLGELVERIESLEKGKPE